MKGERFVEIFQVEKAYPQRIGRPVVILEQIDLILREAEFVTLIGHSGCGKSTLLNLLAGLQPLSGGSIAVGGREISGPGPDRAVVFQAPCLLPWMTAMQNVMLGVETVFPHRQPAELRDHVTSYLELVGLGDAIHCYPRELSGGMQQRVGLARALALEPQLLLLDEPFGRLDSLTRMELQDVVLRVLDRQHITTVLVTHDVDEALYMSDRVCMMTVGPRARIGQILELPWAHPRERSSILEHSLYYDFRGCLLSFLEQQGDASARRAHRAELDAIEQHVHRLLGRHVNIVSPAAAATTSASETNFLPVASPVQESTV